MSAGAVAIRRPHDICKGNVGCFGSVVFPRSTAFTSYRIVSDDMPDIMKQPSEPTATIGTPEIAMQYVVDAITPVIEKYGITHWAAYKNIGTQSKADTDISKDDWMLSMEEHLTREKTLATESRSSSPRRAPVVPFPDYATPWDAVKVRDGLINKFNMLLTAPGTCEGVHLVLFSLPVEEGSNSVAVGMNVTCKVIKIDIV